MNRFSPFLLTTLLAFSPMVVAQEAKQPEVIENPLPARDEASELLSQAKSLAIAGDKDGAFALYEKILQIPLPPDARPPGQIWPKFVDWRGEARWKMAQIRRSQGRWGEALALYQLNRKTYPRNEGCVPSGAALQEMVMVEGECLEHLGRFDEAVALYFPAAVYLDSGVTPEAMRRLFELYQSTNQLDDFTRNLAKEQAKPDSVLDLDMPEHWREHTDLYGPLTTFKRIQRFRNLARLHQWDDIVLILYKPDTPILQDEWGNDIGRRDLYRTNLREAANALKTLDMRSQNEARQKLQEYVKRNWIEGIDNERLIDIRVAISMIGSTENEDVRGDALAAVEQRRNEVFISVFDKDMAPPNLQPSPLILNCQLNSPRM